MNFTKLINFINGIRNIITVGKKSNWSIKSIIIILTLIMSLVLGVLDAPITTKGKSIGSIIKSIFIETTVLTASAPATAQEEFGFSPEGSAKLLVLKFVASTTRTLDIMAYGFTSPEITDALIHAHQRGVIIRLVVDAKANTGEEASDAAKTALNRLVKAGIKVRIISIYPIHHDKVMIADGKHLENGSFNFTSAAQSRNSENVSVRWNNPQAAAIYTEHFLNRWDKAKVFVGI